MKNLNHEDQQLIDEKIKKDFTWIIDEIKKIESNERILTFLQHHKSRLLTGRSKALETEIDCDIRYYDIALGWMEVGLDYYQKEENKNAKVPATTVLPEGFKKNDLDISQETLRAYFSILNKEKNSRNGRPYMEIWEIERLIRRNFLAFSDEPTAAYITINLEKRQKGILRYFVYQFYELFDKRPGIKRIYADFLIYNFELFKGEKAGILSSNMSWSKAPTQGRIFVEKYESFWKK